MLGCYATSEPNKNIVYISKSDQARKQESEGKKSVCGFLGPPGCFKNVDPERYVSCGSYELLVRILANQINTK